MNKLLFVFFLVLIVLCILSFVNVDEFFFNLSGYVRVNYGY